MLKTFGTIRPFIKFKPGQYSIDNIAFKLHYRWTFAILTICSILVTSQQYFGDHIKCISGIAVPNHVIETFCFFTSTFTLVQHINNTALKLGAIPHPGIGPYTDFYKEDPIKRHAYYQWVPFVLFGQALLFYVPHYLWKTWEGGRIKIFSVGLKNVELSRYVTNTPMLRIGNTDIPSKDTTDNRIRNIKISFKNRLKMYTYWTTKLTFCETLNLINILFQIYLVNIFLAGNFLDLGIKVMNQNWNLELDILDIVFPKMTKCHFHKFGASGGLQLHDALCVMALNIINEKIYTFLWFWFLFMLIVSILAIIWRFVIVMFYRSSAFSSMLFSYSSPGRLNRHHVDVVIQRCNFSDWLFLYYLGSNIDNYLFRDIFEQLTEEFEDKSTISNTKSQFRDSNGKEVTENVVNQQSEEDEHLIKQKSIDTVDSPQSTKTIEDSKNK